MVLNVSHELLQQAADGDIASWGAVLTNHMDRLSRFIALRLDRRVNGRIDADDVVQEIYLEAWRHLPAYLGNPTMPFYLWLRGITGHKINELHRHHLGTQMRDAKRELAPAAGTSPETSTIALAEQILGRLTSPSQAAIRSERKRLLLDALNGMPESDRELLAMRHFEHLSPAETAQVLGIQEKAAGMRYLRSLKQLKVVLASLPGGLAEFEL